VVPIANAVHLAIAEPAPRLATAATLLASARHAPAARPARAARELALLAIGIAPAAHRVSVERAARVESRKYAIAASPLSSMSCLLASRARPRFALALFCQQL